MEVEGIREKAGGQRRNGIPFLCSPSPCLLGVQRVLSLPGSGSQTRAVKPPGAFATVDKYLTEKWRGK